MNARYAVQVRRPQYGRPDEVMWEGYSTADSVPAVRAEVYGEALAQEGDVISVRPVAE